MKLSKESKSGSNRFQSSHSVPTWATKRLAANETVRIGRNRSITVPAADEIRSRKDRSGTNESPNNNWLTQKIGRMRAI